ncbi:isoaspartyl peptidase/L-asparaginase-like isoform X1 [Acanthaster planci]|uniref:Isoaspartyl peptidase/L-asparaginase-like isoform X1 n=1 Tax=Acanthaster planci TaxID=133434 RepID=A0A8B7YI99_ACAPL|nr:isoaspartyl peptidase/L-asparaginase-like isoform X1 [Acanthaster planci]
MSSNDPVNQNYPSTIKPVVLVHGGAWAIPDGLVQASCQGVQNAAREGYRVLEEGGKGTALDAVVAAVCILEDDPAFDAGTGSVLNEDGEVEMDAIVMEGQHLKTGAVACVKNIRNPVKLARLVMEKTEHILLVGDGANKFAKSVGMKEVPVATLVSDNAVKELEHFKKFNKTVDGLFSTRDHDTVGAVAVDSEGNVACATSTGGITAKMAGRVGDSPLIGSGAYCDSAAGSASATGHGESIAKVTLARQGPVPRKQLRRLSPTCQVEPAEQGGPSLWITWVTLGLPLPQRACPGPGLGVVPFITASTREKTSLYDKLSLVRTTFSGSYFSCSWQIFLAGGLNSLRVICL